MSLPIRSGSRTREDLFLHALLRQPTICEADLSASRMVSWPTGKGRLSMDSPNGELVGAESVPRRDLSQPVSQRRGAPEKSRCS
jgi:hypothetical protein